MPIICSCIFREAMGEDPNSLKKEDKEEQSKSKRQIEDSRQVR